MGIDHTNAGSDTNAESVEQESAVDRRPPPPPDKPGTDGYPSRADSRNGAAAANDTSAQATDKPDPAQPQQETSSEQGSATAEDGPKTPTSSDSDENESSGERGVTGERPDTGRVQTDTADRSDAGKRFEDTGSASDDGGQERAPGSHTTPRDSTTTVETGEQSWSADAVEQRQQDKGAGEISSAENTEPASADTSLGQDNADTTDNAPIRAEDFSPAPETLSAIESPDARRHAAADEAREEAKTPEDVSAVTRGAEHGPQTAEKPQADAEAPPRDAVPLTAEAGQNDGSNLDVPAAEGATPDVGESAADTGVTIASGAETTAPDVAPSPSVPVHGQRQANARRPRSCRSRWRVECDR